MKKLLLFAVVVMVAIASSASLTSTSGLNASITKTVAEVNGLHDSKWVSKGISIDRKVAADPPYISVSDALDIISNLGENIYSDYAYCVQGIVTGEVIFYNDQAIFVLSDTSNQLKTMQVQVYGLNNEAYKDGTIKEGDVVLVYGYLYNYYYDDSYIPYLYSGYIVSFTNNNSEAYNNLRMAIVNAKSFLKKQKLTMVGSELLSSAIESAINVLDGNDDEAMITALAVLNEILENVEKTELLAFEEFSLNTSSSQYYNGDKYITGEKVRLLFSKGTGSNPNSNSNGLDFYNGNTLYIESTDPDCSIYGVTVNGFKRDNYGSITNEPYFLEWNEEPCVNLTFTNNCGVILVKSVTPEVSRRSLVSESNSWTLNLKSVVVAYDNPSAETLISRIFNLLQITDKALQSIKYENVPGKSELESLADSARAMTIETDIEVLKMILRDLRLEYAQVVELDSIYQTLESKIIQLESTIQENPYADSELLVRANDIMTELRQGIAEGIYTAMDVSEQLDLLDSYIYTLSKIYLTIQVENSGSLGDLILDKVENFSDVFGLRVSGQLNSDDWTTLKNRMTGMRFLDLAGVNMTTLPNEMFYGNTALNTVVLPNTLENIGDKAFYQCTNLTDVTIPVTLRQIGNYAFAGCLLRSIYLPEGLESIGNYSFFQDATYMDANYNYLGLTEIILPTTLITLGQYAFGNQKALASVEILNGLTSIGTNAFSNCISLKTLLLPSTLRTINSSAFYMCSALQTLDIPEGVTTIGQNAFYGCKGLIEVNLPSSLQSVYNSFSNCGNITKMTCKAIVPPSANGYNVLEGLESKCTLTVSNLSVKVYKQTTYWDQFNIEGEDYLPEKIQISSDFRLNWPDNVPEDYNPSIYVSSSAALTVSGNNMVSSSYFRLIWDTDYARDYTYTDLWGNTTHVRDNYYAALMSNGFIRSDLVNVLLYTRVNEWDFLSFPFDVKVSQISSGIEGTPLVIRKYDGQKRAEGATGETWVNMTADSTLHAGQGYIWQSAPMSNNSNYNSFLVDALQTVNKNNLFTNDNVEIELADYSSEFSHNRSWNLIGNPYPAYYDIRAIQTSAPITVWDTYNRNYRAYSPIDDTYILNPGQAFFVQRPINEESITFLKDGRQIDMTVRSIDYSNRASNIEERSVFNILLTGNEMSDRTRFVINEKAKMEYEEGRDACKFMSEDQQSVQLYTIVGDVRYSINERPYGDGVIELAVKVNATGTYTFTLDSSIANEVYLIDRTTDSEVRIDGTDGYSCYVEKGSIEGRFAIRLGNGDVTGIKDTWNKDIDNEKYFNLNGVCVNKPQKGLYIKNGKKVVVK